MLNTDPPVFEAKFQAPQDLPNATLILVFGIISIPLCCFCGIIGLTLGIIALVMADKAKKMYLSDPEKYTLGSYNNVNSGKICAIIGVSLSGLHFIYEIVMLIFYGTLLSTAFMR